MSQERVQHASNRLAWLAARQHGAVTLSQLYSLGFSDSQVRTRVASGWLHPLHRGVFAVGRRELNVHGRWMAAVLACGDGAVLSHQAAGELWKIRRRRDGAPKIDVTIPRRRGGRPRPGLIVHRLPTLRTCETTTRNGIPVTSPVRTIFDLACRLPHRQLERAVDESERLNLCTEDDLDEMVRAHAGRPGTGALSAMLREHLAGSTATRNDFEERFLALCRGRHLPRPEVNVPLLDYVVDFLWPPARLIVEVDGRSSHATRLPSRPRSRRPPGRGGLPGAPIHLV